MKIAWIFPQNKLCGISFYSHSYVEALKPYIDVRCIDPVDFLDNKGDTVRSINQCQLVHFQYETSFFLRNNKDWYFDLCAAVKCPITVTLHEVYSQFPGVFPRDSIGGILPLRKMKQWLYDRRHPYITALTKHINEGFYGRVILVHSEFQKDILIKKGVSGTKIIVLPIPVDSSGKTPAAIGNEDETLNIASTGFINDSYNYQLLFNTLALCDLSWRFTWIGGIRRPDDQKLFKSLEEEIERRHWRDRFTITGTVSKEKRDELLSKTHVYCAFFKYKSSSESLATAIGARTMILATPLPLMKEMTAKFPIMLIAPDEPYAMAKAIRRMATDENLRTCLGNALTDYCREYGREAVACRLVSIYERELGR